MESASQLASRLSRASIKKAWDVYSAFSWPESLDPNVWSMSPELISIHGTELWDSLDQSQRLRLSLYEVGNFFSLVLQGERPLVQGLAHRLYLKPSTREVTEYLHHFIDEENKHMIMFGLFCDKYVGKVYPEKKIALGKTFAKGEEDVAFFCKVLVVEELGDYYNLIMMRDERLHPIVQQLNQVHHVDEARHLSFGRQYLRELWEKHSPKWSPETLAGFRDWLATYLRSSWSDYYNPQMYTDAGLPDGYAIRQMALAAPSSAEHRKKASAKLVQLFLDVGLLVEEPQL